MRIPYKMSFGKYKGEDIKDVPDSYLEYLLDWDDLYEATRRQVEAELNRRNAKSESRSRAQEPRRPGSRVTAEVAEVAERIIKSGYRKLAVECHPDKGGDPEAMVRVNRAVEVLRELLANA